MLERVSASDSQSVKGQAHQLMEKMYQVAQDSPAFQRYAAVEELSSADKNRNPSFRQHYATPPNLDTAKADAFLIFRAVATDGDNVAFSLFQSDMAGSHHRLMNTVFPYFEKAIEDVIADLKASGKWAVLEGQKLDSVDFTDEELPIPPEHRPLFTAALKATEERLLAAIEQQHGATQYAASLCEGIRRQLRAMDAKVDRVGRKDIILQMMGLLFSIAASAVLPAEVVRGAAVVFMAKIKTLSLSLIQ